MINIGNKLKFKKEGNKNSKTKDNIIKKSLRHLLLSEYFVLYICIVSFILLLPIIPNIARAENLGNIIDFVWPLFIIAIGQTFVFIIAGIDLSQTAVISVTSIIGSLIMSTSMNPDVLSQSPMWGWFISEKGGALSGNALAVPVAIISMLAVGSFIGLINGLSIAKLKMPPFMVTLVTQMFFAALAIFLTQSNNIISLPDSFNKIGNGKIWIFSYALIIALVLGIISHIILSKTVLGSWLYSVGTNLKTSVISGVPTDKVIIFAYAFSGFCAAVGSVIYSSRLQMGGPTLGNNILMDIVGATIIGGTSMFGGKGKVVWTLFGVLFFMLLTNVLNLFNLSYFTINIVKGAVILIAALLDVTRTRILQRESQIEKAGV